MAISEDNLKSIREEYEDHPLELSQLRSNPLEQFEYWFSQALEAQAMEPNAMVLATSKIDTPKARYVLFKGLEDGGLIFHTHYESAKAKEIETNNAVAAVIYWREIHRQVRVEGRVEKASKEISDNYFHTRPRGGQLSAIASPQSQVIESRKVIEEKIKDLDKDYGESKINRPDNWGGYLIKPTTWEFWQGRRNRTHDRFRYESVNGKWTISRLAP